MEKVKERVAKCVNFAAAVITILMAILPSDFPYKYRCIAIIALISYFFIKSALAKLVHNYRVTLIPSLMLIIAVVLFWQFRPITLQNEVIVFRNCGELFLQGETISVETVKSINKLNRLRTLRFDNCVFEDDAFPELDLPDSIRSFMVSECSGISNFECISGASSLHVLVLDSCGLSDSNFPNLTAIQLDQLSVAGNPDFSDLSCFPNAHLNYINISNTAVSDLNSLLRYEGLEEIVANNTGVSDLNPLSSLTCLKSLSFDNCYLKSVTEDFMSLRMESLSFANSRLSDCSGFQNFTQLKYVNLEGNNLRDVSWLSKSTATLEQVYLGQNFLSSVDVGFLSFSENMRVLDIHGIQVGSLEIIRNMERLLKLDVRHCGLTDISALRFTSSAYVCLGDNPVQDFSSLVSSSKVSRYGLLDLSRNKVERLHLENLRGHTIILNYFEGLSEQTIEFEEIYIVNCPIDQRVKIEDQNGSNTVFYVEPSDVSRTVERFKEDYQFYARQKSAFNSNDDVNSFDDLGN